MKPLTERILPIVYVVLGATITFAALGKPECAIPGAVLSVIFLFFITCAENY